MAKNYEKMYKELVEQVKWERGLAIEAAEKHPEHLEFNDGALFAYNSIMSKIKYLEEGEDE